MTWRDKAAPIIAAVINQVGTDDLPRLRRALREAFPFGAREFHPYKIWCDEIRVQLGTKPVKEKAPPVKSVTEPVSSDQRTLFE
jgi:hypothetical protein